ncbi:hypothetical protein D3C72_2270820 [compost metagenome]
MPPRSSMPRMSALNPLPLRAFGLTISNARRLEDVAIGTCWTFRFEIFSTANGDGFTDINGNGNEIFLRPLMIGSDDNKIAVSMLILLTTLACYRVSC